MHLWRIIIMIWYIHLLIFPCSHLGAHHKRTRSLIYFIFITRINKTYHRQQRRSEQTHYMQMQHLWFIKSLFTTTNVAQNMCELNSYPHKLSWVDHHFLKSIFIINQRFNCLKCTMMRRKLSSPMFAFWRLINQICHVKCKVWDSGERLLISELHNQLNYTSPLHALEAMCWLVGIVYGSVLATMSVSHSQNQDCVRT